MNLKVKSALEPQKLSKAQQHFYAIMKKMVQNLYEKRKIKMPTNYKEDQSICFRDSHIKHNNSNLIDMVKFKFKHNIMSQSQNCYHSMKVLT